MIHRRQRDASSSSETLGHPLAVRAFEQPVAGTPTAPKAPHKKSRPRAHGRPPSREDDSKAGAVGRRQHRKR
ncbi:unnamed protein product [Ectocarpus sp. 4 AP-2014]